MTRLARHLSFCVALCGVLLLTGCAPDRSEQTADSGQRPAQAGLNQATAELRSRQLDELDYQLSIELNDRGEPFSGTIGINFTLTPQGQPLTIDFTGGAVSRVTANGSELAFDYNGWFISLDEAQLVAGANQLEIDYSHPYSSDGAGLYYFTDPADGRVYTYSDLEPYDANRIMPLFDQPDLKAPFALTVTAPAHWEVISNQRESAIEQLGHQRRWLFPAGRQQSSYVFALHAGEYAQVELEPYRAGDLEIPLRLFSRQSLRDHLPVAEWQQITHHGFAFFNDFFGIDYPFGKYDQLAVPDFNSGAMENIGAVTFNDSYCCLPGERSLSEQSFFKNAVLHELAHMWFGNLVTLAWWDDLWLNESFAEIAGYFALEALADSDAAREQLRTDFLWQRKTWGYRDDDYITSHPIRGELTHTDGVRSAIDGITYAKGGAVLRQLRAKLGDDTFIAAIRAYIAQHSYANSRYDDLLAAFTAAAGEPLDDWSQSWMKTIGVNRVSADSQCSDGQISHFSLHQSSGSNSELLRSHHLDIALYSRGDDGQLREQRHRTVLSGASVAIDELIGASCPLLVLPNATDIAFIKVNLDPARVAALPSLLAEIDSPLQRSLVWIALADSVIDGNSSAGDYIELALAQLPIERDLQLLTGITQTLGQIDSYLQRIAASDSQSAAGELLALLRERGRQLALAGINGQLAAAEPLAQRLWFDFYRGISDASQLTQMQGWLDSNAIGRRPLDQRERWLLLALLGQFGGEQIDAQIEAEAAADPSARGHRFYLRAKAASADNDHKLKAVSQVANPASSDSLANRRALLAGVRYAMFDGASNQQLVGLLVDRILSASDQLTAGVEEYAARALLPNSYTCTAQWSARISNRLAAYSRASPALINALKESRQNNQRCLVVKKGLDASS